MEVVFFTYIKIWVTADSQHVHAAVIKAKGGASFWP